MRILPSEKQKNHIVDSINLKQNKTKLDWEQSIAKRVENFMSEIRLAVKPTVVESLNPYASWKDAPFESPYSVAITSKKMACETLRSGNCSAKLIRKANQLLLLDLDGLNREASQFCFFRGAQTMAKNLEKFE